MDQEQLKTKLEKFKQACIEKGSIDAQELQPFDFEEAYPGLVPTPFIVDVRVKEQWLETHYNANPLHELIDLLYENTDADTLEGILTLRLSPENTLHWMTM
jgi:hypothetical protein